MSFRRRDILKAGAAIAACAALPSLNLERTAHASGTPRNLIVVLNTGGWDTTYALDPKPGLTSVDTPEGTMAKAGNIDFLDHASRPKVKEFFNRYSGITALVRGVQVRSFIHPDCTKRVLTGTPSDTNPDVGAICAYEHGRDMPVPYFVLGSSALSGPLASITGRAGTTNQIAALLSAQSAYPDPGSAVPTPGFVPASNEDALTKKYLDATTARLRATRGMRGSNAKQLDAFIKSMERAGLLRGFAKKNPAFGKREYVPELSVQVSVGVAALESGLSRAVMMETSNWDTHGDNTLQSYLHESLFKGLVSLTEQLEQKQLLANTVVVVLSEMGRTPKLNGAGGKDHWPVTSALVFGAGVAGDRVLGATDDQIGAASIDLATGKPSANGKQLQTGNLVAGVLELAGVDPAAYLPGVEPFRAIRA